LNESSLLKLLKMILRSSHISQPVTPPESEVKAIY